MNLGRWGITSTQDQKTRTVSTCFINPGGLALNFWGAGRAAAIYENLGFPVSKPGVRNLGTRSRLSRTNVSGKTKGPQEQRGRRISPQNPSSKKGRNGALFPFHRSLLGKCALEISQFLRRNFWMISGAPFSPGPFVLLLKKLFLGGPNTVSWSTVSNT